MEENQQTQQTPQESDDKEWTTKERIASELVWFIIMCAILGLYFIWK